MFELLKYIFVKIQIPYVAALSATIIISASDIGQVDIREIPLHFSRSVVGSLKSPVLG